MSDKDQDETGLGTEEYSMEKLDQMVIERQRERFNQLPIKEAVSELEELPQEKIRDTLAVFGILEDHLKLRETVEASLKLVGDEEHSAIIAVLEPEEIGQIIALSPEVFSQDLFDLIKPEDFRNPQKWFLLTAEEKKRIESSGNKFYCQLVHELHDEPWAYQGEKGPWAIFREHVVISSETVYAYVSAICYAHKRDDDWKLEALEAIGWPLIAYAALKCPEILGLCRELDNELGKRIRHLQIEPNFKANALDKFQAAFEEIQDIISQTPKEKKKPLMKLVSELKDMGVDDPTDEEINALNEAGETLENVLKTGLPENGKK